MSTPDIRQITHEESMMFDFVVKTGSAVYNYSLGRLYGIEAKTADSRRLKMYLRDFFSAIDALDWVWNWDADELYSELTEEAEVLFGDLFIRLRREYAEDVRGCSGECVEAMLKELFDKLCEYEFFAISCQEFMVRHPDDYRRCINSVNPCTQKPNRVPVTSETVTMAYGFTFSDSIVVVPFWR